MFSNFHFLKFFATKPLLFVFLQTEQNTREIAHLKFFEFITRFLKTSKLAESSKTFPQNVPNTGRGEGVPSEANVSQFWMS